MRRKRRLRTTAMAESARQMRHGLSLCSAIKSLGQDSSVSSGHRNLRPREFPRTAPGTGQPPLCQPQEPGRASAAPAAAPAEAAAARRARAAAPAAPSGQRQHGPDTAQPTRRSPLPPPRPAASPEPPHNPARLPPALRPPPSSAAASPRSARCRRSRARTHAPPMPPLPSHGRPQPNTGALLRPAPTNQRATTTTDGTSAQSQPGPGSAHGTAPPLRRSQRPPGCVRAEPELRNSPGTGPGPRAIELKTQTNFSAPPATAFPTLRLRWLRLSGKPWSLTSPTPN